MQHGVVRKAKFLAILMAAVAVPSLSAPAAAPTLAALGLVEPGQWQLRSRTDPGENRSLCLGDTHALLQIRHRNATCSRFVIANDPKAATVHYTCPGAGHGRTTVRVETPRLIQIDSQGVAANEPFAVTLEGRRMGVCTGASGASH